MFDDVVSLLRCPVCGSALSLGETISYEGAELVSGSLSCADGHRWRIADGVLDFGVKEGPSDHWSQLLPTYEDFLRNDAASTDEYGKHAIEHICAYVNDCAPHVMVDVATGSASMLRNILDQTTSDTHFIATDLSFVVLKYDRRFLQERYPNKRVSFIACDGADLPFQSDSIDMVVSFAGIGGNCLDKSIPALREAARVLAPGGRLAHEQLLVKHDSAGYQKLMDEVVRGNQLDAHNMIDFTVEGITQAYREMSLDNVSIEIAEEGYGDPGRDPEGGPMFPYPNEWYGEAVVTSRKKTTLLRG